MPDGFAESDPFHMCNPLYSGGNSSLFSFSQEETPSPQEEFVEKSQIITQLLKSDSSSGTSQDWNNVLARIGTGRSDPVIQGAQKVCSLIIT